MQTADMDRSARTQDGAESAGSLARLAAARYARDPQDVQVAYGDVFETLLSHRSVRAYLPEPVPQEHLKLALAAAQSAASSSNLQAWSVVAVREPARKSRLAVLAADQKHIHQAPLLLVWLADLARLRKVTAFASIPGEGIDYLEMFIVGIVDVALAAQNAQIALEAMGYGTCYIGSMRSHPEEVAAELDLPPEVFPIFGMTVGREDPARTTGVKPRLPQDVVCFDEQYGTRDTAPDVAGYDAVMREFQIQQGMSLLDWSVKCGRRVESAASLKNRDKLKQYIENMGFGLK